LCFGLDNGWISAVLARAFTKNGYHQSSVRIFKSREMVNSGERWNKRSGVESERDDVWIPVRHLIIAITTVGSSRLFWARVRECTASIPLATRTLYWFPSRFPALSSPHKIGVKVHSSNCPLPSCTRISLRFFPEPIRVPVACLRVVIKICPCTQMSITSSKYMRSEDVIPCVPHLGTRWRRVVSFTPLRRSCSRWVGNWKRSRARLDSVAKRYLCLARNRTSTIWSSSLWTNLYRCLVYPSGVKRLTEHCNWCKRTELH
jgi:hypothetical protein